MLGGGPGQLGTDPGLGRSTQYILFRVFLVPRGGGFRWRRELHKPDGLGGMAQLGGQPRKSQGPAQHLKNNSLKNLQTPEHICGRGGGAV